MGMFGVQTTLTQLEDGTYEMDWCCGDLAHMELMGYATIDRGWLWLGVETETGKEFQKLNISFCPVCGASVHVKDFTKRDGSNTGNS